MKQFKVIRDIYIELIIIVISARLFFHKNNKVLKRKGLPILATISSITKAYV